MDFKKAMYLHSKNKQSGQAMVEYAILLILMVTLVMGGLELSITAYHSKKTGDAAEAGATSWADAISFSKANPTNPTQQSTEVFEQLLEREREGLNIDTFLNENLGFSYAGNTYFSNRHCGSLPNPVNDPCTISLDSEGHDVADLDPITPDPDDDEIRPFLPRGCNLSLLQVNFRDNFNRDLPIDITACDQTQAGFEDNIRLLLSDADGEITDELFPLTNFRELDPYQDFIEICTSRNNSDGIEKIVTCRPTQDIFTARASGGTDIYNSPANESATQNACISGIPPCPDLLSDSPSLGNNGIDDSDASFRRLLVLKELKNTDRFNNATSASTPTQQGVTIRRGLGNHNPARTDANPFRRPSCSATVSGNNTDYDNGLPRDGRIYLFNPLPINISNCLGLDALRNNLSRVSILVGGFRNNATPSLNIEALPALNQAVYSEYIKVCVVENAGQISIARNGSAVVGLDNCTDNGRAIWLKPPGKMCGAAGGSEVCPDGNGIALNLRGATGFYFFGRTNDAVSGTLTTPNAIFNTFRPAFQIVCDGANMQDANTDANGACLGKGTGSFALEVHTRYRSIFESFLTFGFNRLANVGLAQYFYNPNGVGTSGAVVGAAGSELGPVESIANPIPSLKKIKDFRGCFRVDISPPDKIGDQVKTAVSSCN